MSWTFYSQLGVQKTTETLGSEFPVGTITDYAGTTAPANWLLCDGSTISRSTYSQLFEVIGTAYGAGDGSTTFKIPNSSGKIIYYQRGPAAVTLASTNAPSLVSALPSSPSDGQQVYYQSASMATDGLIWHLRYRQGSSSPYKWEFIGGSELTTNNNNYPNGQAVSNSWIDVTSGATLTNPLAGDYIIEFAGRVDTTTTSVDNYVAIAIATTAIAALDKDAALVGQGGLSFTANQMRSGFSRTARMNGIAASSTVKMQIFGNNSTTKVHYTGMTMRPVRVI